MRFRLRTLMIVLALGPPLAGWIYVKIERNVWWEREKQRLLERMRQDGVFDRPYQPPVQIDDIE